MLKELSVSVHYRLVLKEMSTVPYVTVNFVRDVSHATLLCYKQLTLTFLTHKAPISQKVCFKIYLLFPLRIKPVKVSWGPVWQIIIFLHPWHQRVNPTLASSATIPRFCLRPPPPVICETRRLYVHVIDASTPTDSIELANVTIQSVVENTSPEESSHFINILKSTNADGKILWPIESGGVYKVHFVSWGWFHLKKFWLIFAPSVSIILYPNRLGRSIRSLS